MHTLPIHDFILSKVSKLAQKILKNLTVQCEPIQQSKVTGLHLFGAKTQTEFSSGFIHLSSQQVIICRNHSIFLCSHQREGVWLTDWWIWEHELDWSGGDPCKYCFSDLPNHRQGACRPVHTCRKTSGDSIAGEGEACNSEEWVKFREKSQAHCGFTIKTRSPVIVITMGDTGIPIFLIFCVDKLTVITFFKSNIIKGAKWTSAWESSDLMNVLYKQNAVSQNEREKVVGNVLSKEL